MGATRAETMVTNMRQSHWQQSHGGKDMVIPPLGIAILWQTLLEVGRKLAKSILHHVSIWESRFSEEPPGDIGTRI